MVYTYTYFSQHRPTRQEVRIEDGIFNSTSQRNLDRSSARDKSGPM